MTQGNNSILSLQRYVYHEPSPPWQGVEWLVILGGVNGGGGGVVQVKLYLQQGGYEEGIMTQGTTQFSLCKGMYIMNPIHCKGWEG